MSGSQDVDIVKTNFIQIHMDATIADIQTANKNRLRLKTTDTTHITLMSLVSLAMIGMNCTSVQNVVLNTGLVIQVVRLYREQA